MSFKQAMGYPFKNFKSFWNFWWVIIPIFGWFYLYGYMLQSLASVIKGEHEKGLPISRAFWTNFAEGIKYFIYVIPFYIVYWILGKMYETGSVTELAYVFIIAIITIPLVFMYAQYSLDGKFKSLYNYHRGYRLFFNNIGPWFVVLALTVLTAAVWLLASVLVITLVLTIPAMTYTSIYLVGRFYSRYADLPKKEIKKEVVSKAKTKKKVEKKNLVKAKPKSTKKEAKPKSTKNEAKPKSTKTKPTSKKVTKKK